VSAGGVYLETSSGVSVESGTELILKIAVPQRNGEGATEPLALHCEGRVVRVHKAPVASGPGDERLGIAVQFKHRPNIEFQSLSNPLWLME